MPAGRPALSPIHYFSQVEEQQLLQAVIAHDRNAIDAVYSQVRKGLLKHVWENSGTSEEAKDLIQEAFMVAYIKVTEPGFELTSSLSTYIQGIGHLLWKKYLERYKKRYIPDNRI